MRDGLGIGHEEARVEAARAVGRGDGAADEIETMQLGHDAMGEEAPPAGRACARRPCRLCADQHARFLEGFADGGQREAARARGRDAGGQLSSSTSGLRSPPAAMR